MNQFPPSPWVNLQRWPSNCFFKSANSWAQSTIANPQISEICESANFFWLIRKLQIRKFCWWASPQIANLKIFHYKTERIKHLLTKIPSLYSKTIKKSTAGLFGRIFYLIKIWISVADPWHFGVDPDLVPRIHASDQWIRIRTQIWMPIWILLCSSLTFKMLTKN